MYGQSVCLDTKCVDRMCGHHMCGHKMCGHITRVESSWPVFANVRNSSKTLQGSNFSTIFQKSLSRFLPSISFADMLLVDPINSLLDLIFVILTPLLYIIRPHHLPLLLLYLRPFLCPQHCPPHLSISVLPHPPVLFTPQALSNQPTSVMTPTYLFSRLTVQAGPFYCSDNLSPKMEAVFNSGRTMTASNIQQMGLKVSQTHHKRPRHCIH